ncbi:MAG TPA: hypothetical protein VJP79_06825 [Nitrososphaera sp.]|nr:hypothetical protein [Nitrososphaera sp.]
MLAQAVSKQSEKSETQAARPQLVKSPEQDARKKSNGRGEGQQRNSLSNQSAAPAGKAAAAIGAEAGVAAAAESKGPSFLSSLADVGKSLQKLAFGAGTGAQKKQEPEVVAPQPGEEIAAPAAKQPGASPAEGGGEGGVKQQPQAKGKTPEKGDGTKGQAKEKATGDNDKKKKKGPGGEKGAAPEKGGAGAAPQKKKKGASAKDEKSPKSPEEDPAFQSVLKSAKKVSKQQARHEPAGAKAAQAQAAAKGPPNEVESQAKNEQIEKMGAQQPGKFDREAFKTALFEKIASVAPKNLEEADDFKKENKASSVKESVASNVKQGKEGAQAGIKQATTQAPDPSSAKPKEVADLPPTPAGPAPPSVGAQQAAPKPKTDSEISLEEGSQSLETEMTQAEVSEEQLAHSNEPQFQDALKSKKDAQQHAKEAPLGYRQDEQGIIAGSEEEAAALAQTQLQSMHEGRQSAFGKVVANQATAKTADEQKRAEVSAKIESIYASTKQQVEARLSKLDQEVNSVFDSGLEQATREFEDYVDRRMSAYKADRYDGWTGKIKWGKDKLFGMPDEVNKFYEEGRKGYIDKMNAVIDSVATIVETGLNEAKDMIAAGRQEIKTYVESLPKDLKSVGKEAADNIESKFAELDQSLEEKNSQLVDSLSQKYVDNLNKVDERISEMKAANKGLVDKAKDAIVGVIKTILKLKDMLLNVLAKVAGVISKIIRDPIGFVGNLVKGVKAGLSNFMSKIGDYLQQGLFEWLFGALSEAGIQMPKSLDFKGIVSLVLQVLGLTYPAIRGRAVKLLGEGVVKGLETGSEIFMTLISEGPGGLWKYIQEKIGDLKETVMEGIKGFLKEKIIVAGITWIVGLLNPASAFIKAAKAIYDIVMFFVTRGSQIMSLVDAIIDSMAAIADGGFGVAAAAVEKALGKAVPVVIGFLASLLGLGGIGEKIKGIIQKVQAPITKAVDWVINKAASVVKSAGKLVGIGKGIEKAEGEPVPVKSEDRTTEQKNDDLKHALADAEQLVQNDDVSVNTIEEALPAIEKRYRLKSMALVIDEATDDAEKVHVHAELNPKGDTKGAKKTHKSKRSVPRKGSKKARKAEAAKGRRQFWILLKNRAPLKRLEDKAKAAHLDSSAKEQILQSSEFQKWKDRWDKLVAKYVSEMEGIEDKDEEEVREIIKSIEDYLDGQLSSLSRGDVGSLINLAKQAEEGKAKPEKALPGYQAGHRVGKSMAESGTASVPGVGLHDVRNFRLEEQYMNEWRGKEIELPVSSLKKAYVKRGLSEELAKSQAIKGVQEYRTLKEGHAELLRTTYLTSGSYSSETELKKLVGRIFWEAHSRAIAEIVEKNPHVA